MVFPFKLVLHLAFLISYNQQHDGTFVSFFLRVQTHVAAVVSQLHLFGGHQYIQEWYLRIISEAGLSLSKGSNESVTGRRCGWSWSSLGFRRT